MSASGIWPDSLWISSVLADPDNCLAPGGGAHRPSTKTKIAMVSQLAQEADLEDPTAAGPRVRGRDAMFRRRFGSGRDRIRTSVWRTSGPADPRDRALSGAARMVRSLGASLSRLPALSEHRHRPQLGVLFSAERRVSVVVAITIPAAVVVVRAGTTAQRNTRRGLRGCR